MAISTCSTVCQGPRGRQLEAAADRRSGVLRVNAVHRDVWFTKAMTASVEAEIVA